MVNSFLHMFFATFETSLFVIGGISAWFLINKRNPNLFSKSLKVALATLLVVAPLQVFIGHLSAEQVYHYQPTKLAAMEAQWETVPAEARADWSLLALPNDKAEKNDFEIKVPGALSYLLELKPKTHRAGAGPQGMGTGRSASHGRPGVLLLPHYDCHRHVSGGTGGIYGLPVAAGQPGRV